MSAALRICAPLAAVWLAWGVVSWLGDDAVPVYAPGGGL